MEEDQLTQKQKEWMAASKRTGRGPMTKTERETLEKLYAEMLPTEQQQLAEYIEEHFASDLEIDETPILKMATKIWRPPSDKLKDSLGKSQTLTPPPSAKK